MAEGGLGPLAALRAATAGGAAALGRNDVGRLAPGALADLIVLDGDPLADPRVLVRPSRIRLVLREGWLSPDAISPGLLERPRPRS
jgi:imidazolonepropionase-like amidohydrolase